jgi:hypothetical protein
MWSIAAFRKETNDPLTPMNRSSALLAFVPTTIAKMSNVITAPTLVTDTPWEVTSVPPPVTLVARRSMFNVARAVPAVIASAVAAAAIPTALIRPQVFRIHRPPHEY